MHSPRHCGRPARFLRRSPLTPLGPEVAILTGLAAACLAGAAHADPLAAPAAPAPAHRDH